MTPLLLSLLLLLLDTVLRSNEYYSLSCRIQCNRYESVWLGWSDPPVVVVVGVGGSRCKITTLSSSTTMMLIVDDGSSCTDKPTLRCVCADSHSQHARNNRDVKLLEQENSFSVLVCLVHSLNSVLWFSSFATVTISSLGVSRQGGRHAKDVPCRAMP